MPFSKYVEVGRVVLINYGPLSGKLATIIDIIDQNKCLIDGPADLTGVTRQVISYKRIALTDFTVKIERTSTVDEIKAAWGEAETMSKWEATSWAKKLAAKKKRADLTDFDRFKLMVARKQKSAIIAKKLAELS
uniref:Large ribosomal subunit protein eL14 domain-containing protein n=1 Tax=Thalassionema nitzschioides TaxID=33649 RepID=A0A6T5XYL5_9STRA|mmetsp:Transcript_6208/g.5063  ORF Transcript_6208/g.5063 Transcript_6208/m.5063 type:complete len:134 (+) Transcript_6208:104-505(+)